jgi:hypothetical protein
MGDIGCLHAIEAVGQSAAKTAAMVRMRMSATGREEEEKQACA